MTMLSPVKVVEIDVSQPIVTLAHLEGYIAVQVLVRWQRVPIGWVRVPVTQGYCDAASLRQSIRRQYPEALLPVLLRVLLANAVEMNQLGRPIAELMQQTLNQNLPPAPSATVSVPVTVAVCTRDRPTDLANCLAALQRLDYPSLEILVVDNAPSTDATQRLVQDLAQSAFTPPVRYVQEPRPGLDWARNRAILEATGEIIAYTDDDVIVDPDWVRQLAQVFGENPQVMAVTGLVIPHELETDAQVLFELNGGFGRGFEQQWLHFPLGQAMHWSDLGTGNLGTGANMAFRRSVFQQVGGFDPALDVGTATQGAGDLELFFRILKAGYPLVYEPRALVRHRHRRDYVQLRSQLKHNGSVYAAFIRSAQAHPDMAAGFLRLGLSWFWSGHLRSLLTSLFFPARFPRDLRLVQLWGCCIGLTTYPQAQRQAAKIVAELGDLPAPASEPVPPQTSPQTSPQTNAVAVRMLELTEIAPLTDVTEFGKTRLFVTWHGMLLGKVELINHGQAISVMQLSQAIIHQLGETLLGLAEADPAHPEMIHPDIAKAIAVTEIDRFLSGSSFYNFSSQSLSQTHSSIELPSHIPVSIIVATYDRPADLQNCLQGLLAQLSPRSVEIIVVDNHPDSGQTAPIVAKFPSVKLVNEPRQGVAYARNAGIAVSQGEIIVTVDDDVSLPPDWLERLLAPLARADVWAVTGNVLPLELETDAQQIFEEYGNGGLGRGFQRFEVNREWFERSWIYAVPTWELGGTANSAYRATLFSDPTIGLMDEALGPGMPSGVGEDIYLFYKILKAGGTICYEATAYLWHKHRRDLSALRRQLYNYSKGFVAYHLTTLLNDRDGRALVTLLIFLPLYHLKQILRWLNGDRFYPLSLIGVEIQGNLAGLVSLWQSRQTVRRQGKSGPYLAREQRLSDTVAVQDHVQKVQVSDDRGLEMSQL